MVILGNFLKTCMHRNITMDMAYSEMVVNEENFCCFKDFGGGGGSLDAHVTCEANSCQGKVAGVLFCSI